LSKTHKGWRDSNWYHGLSNFFREYRKHKIGVVGLGILLIFIGMAVFAPFLGTGNPNPLKAVAPSYLAPSWMSVFDPEGVVTNNYLTKADLNTAPSIHVNGTSGEFNATYVPESESSIGNYVNLTWQHTAGTKLDYTGIDPTGNLPDYSDFVYFVQSFDWPWNGLPNAVNMSISFGTTRTGDFAQGAEPNNNLMFRLYVWVVTPANEWFKVYETLDATYSTTIRERRIPFSYLDVLDVFQGMVAENGTQTYTNDTLKVFVGMAPYHNFESYGGIHPWENYTGSVTFTVTGIKLTAYGGYYGKLGTTFWGSDAYSQLIYGSRVSLTIGILATALSTILGVIVGLVAGYYGGKVDEVLMRFVDFLLVIPGLPLMMVLAIFLGKSETVIIVVIAVLGWTGTARLIRSQVLAEKNKAYVESARAIGATDTYIMFRHVLPNVTPILFANITLGVVGAILSEAGLSFLGLTDVEVPSWGRMLADAQNGAAFIRGAWWVVVFPGLMITLLSLSFTFVGHTLDQVLNPRLRER
jgi:peptide/nickel transport system permease protein